MTRRAPALLLGSVAASILVAACSTPGGVTQTASRGDRVPTSTTAAGRHDDAPSPDDGAAPHPATPSAAFEPAPIEWERYDDAVEVATLEVPVDYADPNGPTFELSLARYRALVPEQRIGTLLVNIGGPGFPSTDLVFFASQVYDRRLLERFDIVGWDPRGTGASEPPIDCIDDYDPYFTAIDSTPDDEAERAAAVDAARSFAEACVAKNGGIVQHVGTNNSARDMDAIRRALGETQVSYFGFSYGSELGATWATLFPETVRAAVFDGAADPNADAIESGIQQMRAFEASLGTFLAQCSADPECAFHNAGDAEAAFDLLLAALDLEPIPGEPGRPPVDRGVAALAVIEAMYLDSYWPALAESLAAAQRGDGSGLLALHDSYYQRRPDGTYGNELEAFRVISCADSPERQTVEQSDADVARYTQVAPRLVPAGSVGGYFCTFFPEAIDPRISVTAAGAGPIVVIGTTGDPATPLESSVRMAETLADGRLVIVEADQHTGYGVNRCVIDLVNEYLIDLVAPESGTECR